MRLLFIALVSVVLASPIVSAGCPHAASRKMFQDVADQVEAFAKHHGQRELMGSKKPVATLASNEYLDKAAALFNNLATAVGDCQISELNMAYAPGENLKISGEGVFFPAASWLRAFFHEAGTFVAKEKRGGLNGSLGAGCKAPVADVTKCGNATIGDGSGTGPFAAAQGTTCANGVLAKGNFDASPGTFYCCPGANQCISKGAVTGGVSTPFCLSGTPETNELCRPENDGLLPTIRFFRGRQALADFTLSDGSSISLADIIALGAAAVVKQCSRGEVIVPIYVGRPEATVADALLPALPSPDDIVDGRHGTIFKAMGLDKKDQVTLLTGSHSIGGFRRDNSPGLTSCPYVPFDCTPAKQFANKPFDNNVFKLSCNGVGNVTFDMAQCNWNNNCPTLTTTTADGDVCPFEQSLLDKFAATACSKNIDALPTPGLFSDKFMCANDTTTRATMLTFANNETAFYTSYKSSFALMQNLGQDVSTLTLLTLPVV